MSRHRHFVGIGGIGMSALARLLLARGERVSGCDVLETPLIARLRVEGAQIAIGHHAAHLGDADSVIVSSAIDRQNPEIVQARRLGLPIVHRGELLAELLDERDGIAICGTHGKTTTTAMTHAVLRAGGIDAGLALGGIDIALDTNAWPPAAAWFVTEADESDGSFMRLHPRIAVLTNVENDHLASDDELPALAESLAAFLAGLPRAGVAIVGLDDPRCAQLLAGLRTVRTRTFGLAVRADVRAERIRCENFKTTFDAVVDGCRLGSITLPLPGVINVRNALAALTVGGELGIPFARMAYGLETFLGVRRRFEVLFAGERMSVVDDYAHHPTAVRETIAAARAVHAGPLLVAFQPHRYTRTAYLAPDFAHALRGADAIYLAPIYAASEEPITGVDVHTVGDPLERAGGRVSYVTQVDDLVDRLIRDAPQGALVLMLGAGNISDVAAALATQLRAQVQAPV